MNDELVARNIHRLDDAADNERQMLDKACRARRDSDTSVRSTKA